jgi:hypothetical protein
MKPNLDKEEIKKDNPTFKVTISAEKIVAKKQTYNFTTRFSAPTLEEAFKTAQEKATKMKEEDPEHNEYVVTFINIT